MAPETFYQRHATEPAPRSTGLLGRGAFLLLAVIALLTFYLLRTPSTHADGLGLLGGDAASPVDLSNTISDVAAVDSPALPVAAPVVAAVPVVPVAAVTLAPVTPVTALTPAVQPIVRQAMPLVQGVDEAAATATTLVEETVQPVDELTASMVEALPSAATATLEPVLDSKLAISESSQILLKASERAAVALAWILVPAAGTGSAIDRDQATARVATEAAAINSTQTISASAASILTALASGLAGVPATVAAGASFLSAPGVGPAFAAPVSPLPLIFASLCLLAAALASYRPQAAPAFSSEHPPR